MQQIGLESAVVGQGQVEEPAGEVLGDGLTRNADPVAGAQVFVGLELTHAETVRMGLSG